jgi:hypothetical protein
MRALNNRDIATGTISTTDNQNYSSTGTSSTWQYQNDVPDSPAPTCYVRALLASCTDDQIMAVVNGTALVRDWIVIDENTTTLWNGSAITSNGTTSGNPASSLSTDAGGAGATASTTSSLTGIGSGLGVRFGTLALAPAMAVAMLLQ